MLSNDKNSSLFRKSVIYRQKRFITFGPECHYAECRCSECHYAECRCSECHYAECRCSECHYTECHYAQCRSPIFGALNDHFLQCFDAGLDISLRAKRH
jgi:hypothetical protein